MTIEEKARAYDEALERAKKFNIDDAYASQGATVKSIFPQLHESEDERIIEEIKFAVMQMPSERQDTKNRCLAWLEKQKESLRDFIDDFPYSDQKEQKSIENEDERIRKALINYFKAHSVLVGENWNGIECDDVIAYLEKQKEQKPILEVFGFKVGDAVRLKDGDGRKHIIKSFEEVEGLHGPNFYHVEFEDNSASNGIYPGEEYPNGYYTQMEKFEEEQKPAKWSEDIIQKAIKEVGLTQHQIDWFKTNVFPPKQEWSEEDEGELQNAIDALEFLGKKGVYESESGYDAALKAASWLTLYLRCVENL